MKLTHKTFTLDKVQVKDDNGSRTIEGWASTFGNKDSGGDIILPGAFAESLTQRKPKMLWQHNTDQPIGVWEAATETEQGLYVKGTILDTSLGNDAYKLAKAGAIDSMSIGYTTIDATMDYDSGVRTLKTLDLWEVSLVTFPMNEMAKITTVKAMAEDVCEAHSMLEQAKGICAAYMSGDMPPTKEAFSTVHDHITNAQALLKDPDNDGDDDSAKTLTPRNLERLLREAGLSKREARGFVAKGYPALNRCDADANKSEIISLFNQFR